MAVVMHRDGDGSVTVCSLSTESTIQNVAMVSVKASERTADGGVDGAGNGAAAVDSMAY